MKIFNYLQFIKESRIYKIFWTKEKCAEEALKYHSRNEFRKENEEHILPQLEMDG